MGIRNNSSIRLISSKISGKVPLSSVPSEPVMENSDLDDFLSDFALKNNPKCFIPQFDPTQAEWTYGGVFFPVDRSEYPDTFSRLEELSGKYSGKPIKKKIGGFKLLVAEYMDQGDPPCFTVLNRKGEQLAQFSITTDEDDDVLNINIDWNAEIRALPQKERDLFIVRNNHLITWVLDRL